MYHATNTQQNIAKTTPKNAFMDKIGKLYKYLIYNILYYFSFL